MQDVWGWRAAATRQNSHQECGGGEPREIAAAAAAAASPDEDLSLLRRGQAGDQVALTDLLARHEGLLYRLCCGMVGHDDAEDAVQETFLRALRALPRFRGEANVRTWLFRIAVNICLEWKRARRLTAVWTGKDGFPVTATGGATASPETSVLRALRLREAFAALLPRHRAILLLKELEGWSLSEIGAAMGWNEKKVQNELYKARRALIAWREREERDNREEDEKTGVKG